jgi:hypothetical protein
MKKLSKLIESIWSDMQDRSAGETIRKEDDIDLFDETGLVKYMEKVYMSPNDGTHIIGDTLDRGSILASLFDVDGRYYSIIYKSISTNKPEITFPVCQESDIENKLSKLYKVTRLKQYNDQIYKIEPNDGSKITNKFFLEIFDFILDNVEDGINNINKILFKKTNESIWSDIQDRSAGEVRRKEDGVKVHTCIDVDIYLKNVSDSYYDEFIKEILDYNNSYIEYRVVIMNTRDKAYSWEEMKNIRAFEAPYTYLIYDGGHGTDLVTEFLTYDEMKDFDLDDFEDRVIEDDYISICKGIATKLKEVGGDIKYLPRNKGSFIGKTNEKISDYDGDYVLQLIDESDVYDWEIKYTDKYGEGSTASSLDDYKECMIDTFPELDDVDFITWSFNDYACNIGIPITATTVKNFKKYKEYTKNWFTVDEEAE